jgi:hypothetical protein
VSGILFTAGNSPEKATETGVPAEKLFAINYLFPSHLFIKFAC